MIYENISIVHLENGINVTFNGNESNKEVIFSFDCNKNFIQKFTYTVEIYSEQIQNILSNVDKTVYIDDECFLYYSFNYQESFAHYLTQCLPKIKYYLQDKTRLLVVPKSTYNNLCKDIFNILGIKNENILVLENNVNYIFKNIFIVEHTGSQWHGVGGEINYDGVDVYKKIRNNLNLIVNENPHRKVYLKRDGKKNLEYGNCEVGITRKIVNEDELINFLSSNGFEIIELGEKSILEKSNELGDIHTLITQIGANFMNFIFSNSIKNILLLSNEYPLGIAYYFKLIDIINPIECNKQIFEHPSTMYGVDVKNSTNNPFLVDIHRISNYINSLN